MLLLLLLFFSQYKYLILEPSNEKAHGTAQVGRGART